jgi:hypothetical protein
MIALPWREARARAAEERALRSNRLRALLGPVEGWSEDWRAELTERLAIAEIDGEVPDAEREVLEALRGELLGRLP